MEASGRGIEPDHVADFATNPMAQDRDDLDRDHSTKWGENKTDAANGIELHVRDRAEDKPQTPCEEGKNSEDNAREGMESTFDVGDKVEVRFERIDEQNDKRVTSHPGVISSFCIRDGTYGVTFDDRTIGVSEGISRNMIVKYVEVVQLCDVLRAKSEFQGISHGSWFVFYLIFVAAFPTLLMSRGEGLRSAAVRADMTKMTSSYMDPEGETHYMRDIPSAYGVATSGFWYTHGLAVSLLENARSIQDTYYDKLLDQNCNGLYLGYASVRRMTLHYAGGGMLHVFKFWETRANGYHPDNCGYYNNFTLGLKRLNEVKDEVLKAGKASQMAYAKLTLIASNRAFDKDGALTCVRFANPAEHLADRPQAYTTTAAWRTDALYTARVDNVMRLISEIVFLLGLCARTYYAVKDALRARRSTGSISAYILSSWNTFNLINIFLSWVVLCYWYCYFVPNFNSKFKNGHWNDNTKNPVTGSWDPGWGLPDANTFSISVLMFTLNSAMTALGLLNYFRIHPGLNVYVEVFSKSWTSLQDFFVWFLLVVSTLTMFLYISFSSMGGNESFISFDMSLNYVGRFILGYGDYDSFYVEQGTGTETRELSTQQMIYFWVLVCIGVVFAQNIILATVGKAYDEASEDAEGVDSFRKVIAMRVRYMVMRMRCREGAAVPKEKRGTTRKLGAFERKNNAASIAHELLLRERLERYSRWNAISNDVVRAICAYFQDPLTVKPCLKFWLFDGGNAIYNSDKTLRMNGNPIWIDEDWSRDGAKQKAESFLQLYLTEKQLTVIVEELMKCQELHATILNDLKKWGNSERSFEWLRTWVNSEWFERIEERWKLASFNWTHKVDDTKDVFDAFKSEMLESTVSEHNRLRSCCSTSRFSGTKKPALFLNKQRNLIKTTRSVEDQVAEIKAQQGRIEKDLAKITGLLASHLGVANRKGDDIGQY